MFRFKPSSRPILIAIVALLACGGCAREGWATERSPSQHYAEELVNDASSQPASKPRIIVLTDMTSITPGVREPDDSQSMIRLMLYANEFDIEGLIASSGLQHGHVVRPEIIRKIVNAYGEVQPNLLLHDEDYPSADSLRNVIKSGQPNAGEDVPVYESIGERKDTEGSDWIIQMVDKPDDRPVWIVIWGGPADLAQALWKVRKLRSQQDFRTFVNKIRVIAGGDQDSTAAWIKSRFPELFYVTRSEGGRGMYRGGDTSLVSSQWIQDNIRGHGALGDIYPDYRGGDTYSHKIGKVRGIKGGDSCTYMGLISNGLNIPAHLTWTNWGGRLIPEPKNATRYSDAVDHVGTYTSDMSPHWATVYRWRPHFQADYAARFDWAVNSYDKANHAPTKESGTQRIVRRVSAGEKINLRSGTWRDPDGNNLSYHWQVLREETATPTDRAVENSHSDMAQLTLPEVRGSESIHVLLTVTDDGRPALNSYQRFNLIVLPQ
ncbi:DUF1593 domain-containing protein [Salinisphaera aquimarina]|uniref:Nucleoside hydrolase-like domain-containing protein n=1 Tax=Salinisphaera aquimarina TaxID=2094031 RepID=A0ABV7EST4_9GAMM